MMMIRTSKNEVGMRRQEDKDDETRIRKLIRARIMMLRMTARGREEP